MIDYFDQYLSDPQWLIFEKSWKPDFQSVSESQLALGNGYLCSRAVLEEIPRGACPGTYFAGIYDITGAQVTELVNAPNPIDFRISVKGEKLDITAMNVLGHERLIDMHRGLLVRKTTYANSRKKRFNYQSLRFFSMHNKHIAVMQIYVTPLDEEVTFTVESSVDTAVTNKGLITEGKKKHVHIYDFLKNGNINYLCMKTLEKEVLIAYANQLEIKKGKKTRSVPHRTFKLHLRKGESACITKFFSFYTSQDINPRQIKAKTIKTLRKAVMKGFDQLIKEHTNVWLKKWKSANIEIEGDPDIERVIRFNIYHLLITGSEDNNNISIGARTLTGEGYRGHIFWDTEIFILPFFIYTNPKIAKNMLLYRYHRLDAARKIAKDKGYQGTMFPWESADTGEEATPSWYKHTDGTIRKVSTGFQEHHITSDIAYGVFHYFIATGDIDFMLEYGLEIILETAKFWASRVEYTSRRKKYEIKHVIGPDEYHENVNNNVFTNAMAKWNLEIAAKLCEVLRRKYPSKVKPVMTKINLKPRDTHKWRYIAKRIFIPISKKRGIIEEFDGFFKLKRLPLPELDSNSIPLYPKGLAGRKISKTQFVKQADVVMLLYILSDILSANQKKKNYLFYENRTLHESSLSAAVYSAVGAEVGEKNKAYRYFLTSAYTDLKNIYGNSSDGMHAASLGGTWQAVINGFAGVKIRKRILSFNPKLPYNWKRMKFLLKWKGFDLSVNIDKEKTILGFNSKRKKDYILVRVDGLLHKLCANKTTTFHRKLKQKVYTDIKGVY